MLPSLAGVEDLGIWMGSTIPTSSIPRAEAILAAASTLVRRHTGQLWVDESGDLSPGDDELRFTAARDVVVVVAERVWKNPDAQTQRTAGPFSSSIAAWAALGLALRPEEMDQLTPSDGAPGLGLITTTRGPLETPAVLTDDCWDGSLE